MLWASGGVGAGMVSAQDSLGYFRSDPVRFFTDQSSDTWVGDGRFLMNEYSDTLTFAPDSTGEALVIQRVLVKAKSGVVMSRGGGIIRPLHGDSVFTIDWSEKRYPNLSGRMAWTDGQWVITFEGEWNSWSIRITSDTPESFIATIARSLGSFPAVELAGMTYHLQTGAP
jgi:hypothetical protein